jgi:rare lipoprotein A (peptidoglycan hydrolase)
MSGMRSGEVPSSSQEAEQLHNESTKMDLALLKGQVETMQMASISHQEIRDQLKPSQVGEASWYGPGFQGRLMANGEPFDMMKLTAAHPKLPFGTQVLVMVDPPQKGKAPYVIVTITDRGPYAKSNRTKAPRIMDLSKAAFDTVAPLGAGEVTIRTYVIPKGKSVQDLIASRT